MPVNSQFPTIGNSAFVPNSNPISVIQNGGLLPARVIDISLVTSTNGKSIFQTTGEFANIGAIKFELLGNNNSKANFPQGPVAYPLDNNVRKVPLINEIVFIISGPSRNIALEENSDAIDFYYMNAISIWGRSHLNMLPPNSSVSKNTNTVPKEDVEKGINNNENNQIDEPKPGNIFVEKSDIRNLFPNEGDVIIEGRFGNSLRFGSTAKQPSGSKDVESPWSSVGVNGQPITILRNGQSQLDLDFNNWFPIYEDIQNDDSSIYLTSGQTIPILYGSFRRASFQLDGTPEANTTKLLQEVDIVDPDASPKELDDINNPIDSINQEPDLSTEEKFKESFKSKFNEELDKISELNKSGEDVKTRSNIVNEENIQRDSYRVGDQDR
jgi:hypothetical protein|tara:strand:+ start:2074 stop:3222 length:1149 start_codon:yes stop_codon:yes gene_type:complete